MKILRDYAVIEQYDVLVCGGGPSGCAAAIAAQREGLKVLLIEKMGQLGGMAVSGLVSQWLGGRTQEGNWVVGGLFKTFSLEAAQKGFAVIPYLNSKEKYQPYGWFNWFIHGIPLDPFSLDYYFDKKMQDVGVNVLLYTNFVDVIVDKQTIQYAILNNSSGTFIVPVKAVIDATGNADVANRCGCLINKGRPEDGKTAPASLIFHVYNVNTNELKAAITINKDPKFRDLILELRQKGIWRFPYDIFICTQLPTKGEYYINTIRLIDVDATDGKSITKAMQHGREEVHQLMSILNKYFPGFEKAKIKTIASQLGIRESRKIIGEYTLSIEDLEKEKEFDDCIGFSMYGWDLPDPQKPSIQPFANDEKTGYKSKIKKGLSTPLPYRIMVPKGINNLICPGREVSVEGQALGPVRVMAPCMAMGEAAGMAAWQVIKQNCPFSKIDINILRSKLREVGAIVDKNALPIITPRIDQV